MGDKERRSAGAERSTVGKVCVLNPFLSKSRLDNFSVSGEFCVHVNGFYSFAVGGCYLRPEQEYTIIESVLIKM